MQSKCVLALVLAGIVLSGCSTPRSASHADVTPARRAVAPQTNDALAAEPTPAEWDQWQPQTDRSDGRLESERVTVWERETSVEEVLSSLGEQSGVELRGVEDILGMPVSVFARDCTLGGAMSALAHLFDGYWTYPRAAAAQSREYCLVPHKQYTQPLDVWVEETQRSIERAHRQQRMPERRQRLRKYEEALSLSPEEVLAEYEQTDPWLCADLLDPARRPMVEKVVSLPEAQREAIVADQRPARPLRSLDEEFRQHLATWAKGEWGRPQTARHAPDPDRLPRFQTSEERWRNASVVFWWSGDALRCQLTVPDVAQFDTEFVRTPRWNPLAARLDLARLGYREDTAEYRAAAEQELRAWGKQQPTLEEERDQAISPILVALEAEPNRADPRLDQVVDLSLLEDEESAGEAEEGSQGAGEGKPSLLRLSVAAALEAAAEQCDLAVAAHHIPRHRGYLAYDEGEEAQYKRRLLDLLDEIGRRAGVFTWNFHGRYLVAKHLRYRSIAAGGLSEAELAEWRELLKPGSKVSLDELTAHVADLNWLQIDALMSEIPAALEMPLYKLRDYSRFDAEQRGKLAEGGAVQFAELSPQQRRIVVRTGRNGRPWLEASDFEGTVVQGMPRELSSGQEALSLVFQYHLAESPQDRDVITLPFEMTAPAG